MKAESQTEVAVENPESEIRHSKQFRNPSSERAKPQYSASFAHSRFEFPLCFGFRISDFGFKSLPSISARSTLLYALVLAVLTLALYWPTIHFDFVQYDDNDYVFDNQTVRAGLTWWGLIWSFVDAHALNWHPVTWLSHMLDCQLFGLNAGGHHLVNVLLHCANAALLFVLLRTMTTPSPIYRASFPPSSGRGARGQGEFSSCVETDFCGSVHGTGDRAWSNFWRCAFVAALFAWHPLRVESVAWISERKDVLSGFFFMLTLLMYVRYAKAQHFDHKLQQLGSENSTSGGPSRKDRSEISNLKPAHFTCEISNLKSEILKPESPSRWRFKLRTINLSSRSLGFGLWTLLGRRLARRLRWRPAVGSWSHFMRKRERPLSLIFFSLGLLSKPMLVTVPFILLLLDYWPLRRFSTSQAFGTQHATPGVKQLFREKFPFFALSLAVAIITFLSQRSGGAVVSLHSEGIGARIATICAGYLGYLEKTFWPRDLAVIYLRPPSIPAGAIILGAPILIGLTALAIRSLFTGIRAPQNSNFKVQTSKLSTLSIGWLWFVIMLLPVCGLVQVGPQLIADRYTYLPSIGLAIIVGWTLPDLLTHLFNVLTLQLFNALTLQRLTLAALLLTCGLLTRHQLACWRNTETLMTRALAVDPNNYIAHQDLGVYYSNLGQTDAARAHRQRFRELDPSLR